MKIIFPIFIAMTFFKKIQVWFLAKYKVKGKVIFNFFFGKKESQKTQFSFSFKAILSLT